MFSLVIKYLIESRRYNESKFNVYAARSLEILKRL